MRPAVEFDVEKCDGICETLPGHDQDGEVRDSKKQGTVKVVVHGGRITGYTTGISCYNHSVGLTNDDLKALIAPACYFLWSTWYSAHGIVIPTGNTVVSLVSATNAPS